MASPIVRALLLVILVSGCSAGESNPASSGEDLTTVASVTATSDSANAGGGNALGTDLSRLDEDFTTQLVISERLFWGPLGNDVNVTHNELTRQRFVAIEEEIARCMNSEGFEYVPVPADELTAPVTDPEFDGGTREWAEYFGFGVSSFIVFDDGDLPPGVHGYRGDFLNVRGLEDSPNQLYLQSLSSADRAAYEETLEGVFNLDDSSGEWELVSPGCRAMAEEAVPDPFELLTEPYRSDDQGLRERVLTDPRWIAYEKAVAACVADAGYEPFLGFDQANAMFVKLLEDAGLVPPSEDLVLDDEGNPIMSDSAPMLPPDTPAYYDALREVQETEREYAVTVYDCGGNRDEQRVVIDEILAEIVADDGGDDG